MLAVQDAQRIRMQPPRRVLVEHVAVALEMRDQRFAVRAALGGVADRIDHQRDARKAERTPQPREHRDLLGVDVGTGEAERLDVELMELAIAPLLWTLVPEHRAAGPDAQRPLVDE